MASEESEGLGFHFSWHQRIWDSDLFKCSVVPTIATSRSKLYPAGIQLLPPGQNQFVSLLLFFPCVHQAIMVAGFVQWTFAREQAGKAAWYLYQNYLPLVKCCSFLWSSMYGGLFCEGFLVSFIEKTQFPSLGWSMRPRCLCSTQLRTTGRFQTVVAASGRYRPLLDACHGWAGSAVFIGQQGQSTFHLVTLKYLVLPEWSSVAFLVQFCS